MKSSDRSQIVARLLSLITGDAFRKRNNRPGAQLTSPSKRLRVVYLLGAGASDACVRAVGSAYSTLMKDLTVNLAEELHAYIEANHPGMKSLEALVNDVMDAKPDIEHIITFLDESPSILHRQFAAVVRETFAKVLTDRLDTIKNELGYTPDTLYYALLDMHEVPGCREELMGFLTLNYDNFLDNALERSSTHTIDPGVRVGSPLTHGSATKLLKLHGSFGWDDAWPITTTGNGALWIPPGIQKMKDRYPFNILWGLARELLDCDILRIVGCRLSPNDWDLVSLLFTTRHTSSHGQRYQVEIIDAPAQAFHIKENFPYLDAQSILDIEDIGPELVSELIGGNPRSYTDLSPSEQTEIKGKMDRNWFRLWLTLKAETMYRDLGMLETQKGEFKKLMEAP